MSSRTGEQEPRIRIEPKRSFSDGSDAVELAESLCMYPDPWQRLVLEAWLGRDENDKFTSTTCGLSVPRQNGKNALLEFRELYGLCVIGEQILHSAHEVKTSRTAFLRLVSYFEDDRRFPELAEMVTCIRKTNGQEEIQLSNGASIKFSARSKGAARGMTLDCVVFDESSFITDEQLESMMSTMAAAPLRNRQIIYTGTPPGPQNSGEVFGRVRKAAIEGLDKRSCWHEWSIESLDGTDVTNKALWYQTNPAMGIRLEEEVTATECATMSADGFARERLGWWAASSTASVISEELWRPLQVDASPDPDECKLAYGVKFSPDGSSVALSVALKPNDGSRPYVELIEHRSMRDGTSWLAKWLIERKDKAAVIVIDGRSHTDSLVAQLREGHVSRMALHPAAAKDAVAAASRFLISVREGSVTHYGQPALDKSVLNAKKRSIGNNGGWGWDGIGESDVTPLESATLALWGVLTTKRNPGRRLRLG